MNTGVNDLQKKEIKELNDKLDNLFSDYQKETYRLVYSFKDGDEESFGKALNENYVDFLDKLKSIRESAFILLKSINKEEDEIKLKEIYDKINNQNE